MIEVKNVSKSFGAQKVLNNISLTVNPEEIVAVVGPSGVGKSVLLKLIMGILQPDSGEILVAGKNITTARSEQERNEIRGVLGVLFQSAALFDSLSVYENVVFPLEQHRNFSKQEKYNKVMEILEHLSLEKYVSRYPQELSIGIRKRIGMARALVMEPKIFLFDEPNTGLDPIDGQEVYDLIKLCKDKWQFAGLVISHEIPEVFQVSDRVAMLLNGQIVEIDSPLNLQNSKNPAVCQFLKGDIDGPIQIQ
mgnify:CR=1 FL=1